MIKNIFRIIVIIQLCYIGYYAKKSCEVEYVLKDQDIHEAVNPDRYLLTLEFAAKFFNVIPETKVIQDGKTIYLPAGNQGFIARIINQARRDYLHNHAYNEVMDVVNKQLEIAIYQYICWLNYQRSQARAEIDEFADKHVRAEL